MPSIYDIKPAFQNLLRPLVRLLADRGVTANQVTVLAVILSIDAGAAILVWPEARWPFLCLPAVLLVRMALNAIDGMLAREFDMKTRLGMVLNELGDVVADAALYLPIAVVGGIDPVGIVVVVVLATISEMTGVAAIQAGGERRYDGPMGKSDRAFVFGIVGLALGLGFRGFLWVNLLMALVAVLLILTIINRARRSLQ